MTHTLKVSPFPLNLSHGFFTRQGGLSTGLYHGLNVGLSKGDCPKAVSANREKVAQYFERPFSDLCFPKQVHGNKALFISSPYDLENPPEADALVTNQPGLILGVQTADCVPVFIYDSEVPLVAALHSGWKGALGGIVENTIALMLEKGAKKESLRAAIGPSIRQESYEVDEDFYQTFIEKYPDWSTFFKQGIQKGKFFFGLQGFVKQRLQEEGIQSIHSLDQDTYANNALFFSCRRAFHKGETSFGNQASCIMIRPN